MRAVDAFVAAHRLLLDKDVISAISRFNDAAALGHDPNQCAAGRWKCWMLLGEFERAWCESDLIRSSGAADPNGLWNGSRWDDRRVMLRCLHGLGDTIQFIRFAPLLKSKCKRLIVQMHPELARLGRCVEGVDEVVSWESDYKEDYSTWDLQIEVTELPFATRTNICDLSINVPYISIPASNLSSASEYFQGPNAFRVGLIWQASEWNPARSIPLRTIKTLTEVKGSLFYSLQKGAREGDISQHIYDLGRLATDVLDTAAMMMHLDLILTVDTMTAHLAGALNIPVWIMLPYEADWRWMLNRADSPWYPSARLFRQKQPGEWQSVIDEVRSALDTRSFRSRPDRPFPNG